MQTFKKRYLKARYRFRALRSWIERTRLFMMNPLKRGQETVAPLWTIFPIYNCTATCSYCIQNYSFVNGRMDSPLRRTLPPEHWLKLNAIKNKPESIVISGGEPMLYKGLADILEGLNTFKQITVVSNLTLDVTALVERLRSIRTHKILFECTYHDEAIDLETFISRALILEEAGLLGSVRIVDVSSEKTLEHIGKFADHGLKLAALYEIGYKDGKPLVYKNEDASNLVRKPPVLCKTSLIVFGPTGDVYNCHTKLYWDDKQSSFGNIVSGFEIPDGHYVCHDYGFCNPCQIGHMDVRNVNETEGVKINEKVLLSNPPKNVRPSMTSIPIIPVKNT